MLPIATRFLGTSDLATSVANQEIVATPSGWTMPYQFRHFAFQNDAECHVIINNGDAIYLRAQQGLTFDFVNIESFKIVESGITYNIIAATL